MPRALIIAYGNPLRSDDGVAWRAADSLARSCSASEAEILFFHQLAPELAETVSRFGCVIFIDAESPRAGRDKPGEIRVEQIRAEGKDARDPTRFTHDLTPGIVVSLAAALYGATQQAFLCTVTGTNFDHGEALSPAVADALPFLIERVETIVRNFQTSRPDS